MNSILISHPYNHAGVWVSDDPAVGLVQEPFVADFRPGGAAGLSPG
jgi:hypothetical protein